MSRSRTVILRAGAFDGDAVLGALVDQPLVLELGQIFFHGIIDGELAHVLHHQNRGGGDRLGHRGDPKQMVGAHRLVFFEIGEAHGVEAHVLALARDERDGTRDDVVGHKALHRLGNGLELRGINANGRGISAGHARGEQDEDEGGSEVGRTDFHGGKEGDVVDAAEVDDETGLGKITTGEESERVAISSALLKKRSGVLGVVVGERCRSPSP